MSLDLLHVYSPAHPSSSRGVVAAYDILSHQTLCVAIDTKFVWAYQCSWHAHCPPIPRKFVPSFACTLKYQCPQPSFLRRGAAPPFCVLAEYVVVCATRLPGSSHRYSSHVYSSHVSGYFGRVACLSWILQAPVPGPQMPLFACLSRVSYVDSRILIMYSIMYSSPVPLIGPLSVYT